MDNKEMRKSPKELKKAELKKKIGLLATEYFFEDITNDGTDIANTFNEYLDLTADEEMIDKEVVGFLMDVLLIYQRNHKHVGKSIAQNAEDMAWFITMAMASWSPDYAGKMVSSQKGYSWTSLEELDEIVQSLL